MRRAKASVLTSPTNRAKRLKRRTSRMLPIWGVIVPSMVTRRLDFRWSRYHIGNVPAVPHRRPAGFEVTRHARDHT